MANKTCLVTLSYNSKRPPIWMTRARPIVPSVKPLVMMPAVAELFERKTGVARVELIVRLSTIAES